MLLMEEQRMSSPHLVQLTIPPCLLFCASEIILQTGQMPVVKIAASRSNAFVSIPQPAAAPNQPVDHVHANVSLLNICIQTRNSHSVLADNGSCMPVVTTRHTSLRLKISIIPYISIMSSSHLLLLKTSFLFVNSLYKTNALLNSMR